MKVFPRLLRVLPVCLILALAACDSYNLSLSQCVGDDLKEITAFSFTSPPATGTITGTAIAVTVPHGTDVTGLVPGITVSEGASVSPASGAARNFTSPVTYTVTAADGSTATYIVTVTVTPAADLTTVGAVTGYLSTAMGGTSAASPIVLPPVNLTLASDWAALLTAIESADKFVELDLSGCTMTGTEFDPGTANTGESYITGLVLPDEAISIKGSPIGISTFRYFTNLAEVSGDNVSNVGASAFSGCASLTSISLPEATTIGNFAFFMCTSLASADLSEATTIGESAFGGCTALTDLTLGSNPPSLVSSPFSSTGSGTLTIHVPAGKVTDYTTAWGVAVFTAAIGNTPKYGSNHKAITITDTP
jgi:hypothetical protein